MKKEKKYVFSMYWLQWQFWGNEIVMKLLWGVFIKWPSKHQGCALRKINVGSLKLWAYDIHGAQHNMDWGLCKTKSLLRFPGLSVRAGSRGFSPATTRVCKFYWWVESVWLLLHKFRSHFGIFGVKYQTFQHVVLACIHYREGYTK